jgi:hypothetical protein
MACNICDDKGWVCENHPDKPWDGTSDREDACSCGGAGMPCVQCRPEANKNHRAVHMVVTMSEQ